MLRRVEVTSNFRNVLYVNLRHRNVLQDMQVARAGSKRAKLYILSNLLLVLLHLASLKVKVQ